MRFLNAVAMAFSMFSRIPVPERPWTEENRRWALCALPLVGAAIGLVLWGWTAIAAAFRLKSAIYAVGLALLPVAATGGIHLDGLCDVADALGSRSDPAKMKQIRKDPHVGAFGVISVCCYLLAYYALCTDFTAHSETAVQLLLMHMISRAAGALCSLAYPEEADGQGLLHAFQAPADHKISLILLLVELATFLLLLCLVNPGAAVGALLAVLLTLLMTYRLAAKRFGGMNGDLAGFAIQTAEIAMLFFMILV